MKRLAIFLLFLVLGCSNLAGSSVKSVPREFSQDIEVYFCPRDSCGAELVEFILGAKKSVHCALYDLELENVISALHEKSKYLDVRLVVDNDNIGKRYRRQDEIGTPYCVTVDFDSLEHNDVTVRDRDSMKQERVKVGELGDYLGKKLK